MIKVRVLRQVGGSVMVALPPAMLQHIGGHAGDTVTLFPVDGGVLLTRYTKRMQKAHENLERWHRLHGDGLRRLVPDTRPR